MGGERVFGKGRLSFRISPWDVCGVIPKYFTEPEKAMNHGQWRRTQSLGKNCWQVPEDGSRWNALFLEILRAHTPKSGLGPNDHDFWSVS